MKDKRIAASVPIKAAACAAEPQPEQPAVASAGTRWWQIAFTGVLAVGAGVRLWYFLLDDSLWRDESKLLLNAATKSFSALAGPLDFDQEAPLPLLWLYRVFFLAGAGGELPLRALSLAAGLATLFLFWRLARSVLPNPLAALFALSLLALAPGAILYSAMAKHYALDLLVATLLLAMAWTVLRPGEKSASLTPLTCAAAVAPWLSYPSLFLLAAIGAGLVTKRRGGPRWRAVAGFWFVFALSAGVEVLLVLQRLWLPRRTAIVHEIAGSLKVVSDQFTWLLCQVFYAFLGPHKISWAYLQFPYGYSYEPLVFALLALVMLGLWQCRMSPGWMLVLFGPLLLALAAYGMRLYWPYGRLLLFATPGLCLLAGYGTVWLVRLLRRPALAGLLLAPVVVLCGKCAWDTFARPTRGVREGLEYIVAHQKPGDLVFFDINAAPTIAYYQMLNRPFATGLDLGLPPEQWVEGTSAALNLDAAALLSQIPPEKRVWLISESADYARGKVKNPLSYWRDVVASLGARRPAFSYLNADRVQVVGFGAEQRTSPTGH